VCVQVRTGVTANQKMHFSFIGIFKKTAKGDS